MRGSRKMMRVCDTLHRRLGSIISNLAHSVVVRTWAVQGCIAQSAILMMCWRSLKAKSTSLADCVIRTISHGRACQTRPSTAAELVRGHGSLGLAE
jgi:hypothetical protein